MRSLLRSISLSAVRSPSHGPRQRKQRRKPDADNVAKIVLDSLNGIAWVDDSKVSILTVRKQYSDAYEGIRVWVEAEPTDRREA